MLRFLILPLAHLMSITMPRLRSSNTSYFLTAMFLVGSLVISIIGHQKPWPSALPRELSSLDVATRLRFDAEMRTAAATDFGRLTRAVPAAVFCPSSASDIAALLRFAYEQQRPLAVAPRGHGHSLWGQASVQDGIVIDMRSLRDDDDGGASDSDLLCAPSKLEKPGRLRVLSAAWDDGMGLPYVDAGGEQLWVEVLNETLKRGLAPKSWTDYLYLTVGGTLSNAGVSGQAFRNGPQISNVYELDVVTGKGEMMTCSRDLNPDLFYAVLGGLGQFGVITRARIALGAAPERVRWVRLFYTDFAMFTEDQEYLISLEGKAEADINVNKTKKKKKGFDYVEGSVLLDSAPVRNWRSSFYSEEDEARISSLAAQHGAVYCLEGSIYYGPAASAPAVEQDVERLLEDLSFVPGFLFTNDVGFMDFLNRVHHGELRLRSKGLWDVPHPWLNVFVPKSRILDFDLGVFRGILNRNRTMGPILVYPLYKDKWDERMSSVTPDEDVFYSVGMLWAATAAGGWEQLEEQNAQVLRYCDEAGIEVKQYLPRHTRRAEWVKHFGPKWETFVERKRKYDPKALLSPGQGIFTAPLV